MSYQPQSAVNIYEAYIDSLAKEAQELLQLPYKILFDAGHGPAGRILKDLIARLEWMHADVVLDEANGDFLVHSPDPTSQEARMYIESLLVQKQYDAVCAFDGDADRLVVYLPQGRMLHGDELFFLFAYGRLHEQPLQAKTLESKPLQSVVDIKASATLLRVLQASDIVCNVVPTGCAYIKAALKERVGAICGSSTSGSCTGNSANSVGRKSRSATRRSGYF